MTVEEIKKVMEELNNDGFSDKQIVNAFYKMYQHDELNFEQFQAIIALLGFEVSDHIKQMGDEERKTTMFEFVRKVDRIIENINNIKKEEKLNKIQIKEQIFNLFIENHINDSELVEILTHFKYKLPKDFVNWDTSEKKMYYLSKQLFKDVSKNELLYRRRFCHAYYYDLVEGARKSYIITKQLMNYVAEINNNFPIVILTMQNIKIDNIWKYKEPLVEKYIKDVKNANPGYKIETMYDLYMMVSYYFPTYDSKSQVKEKLLKVINNDFEIDLNDPFIEFFFDIEMLLAWLYIKTSYVTDKEINEYRKIANTIKNQFTLLDSSYLKDTDYLVGKHNARYYLKKVDKHKLISSNKAYFKAYKKILNKYSNIDYSKYKYNGYFALLLCLYGGDDNG